MDKLLPEWDKNGTCAIVKTADCGHKSLQNQPDTTILSSTGKRDTVKAELPWGSVTPNSYSGY